MRSDMIKGIPSPVTIASWKSYRLKRKTVNTLSAECQSLVHGVGNVYWHRLLLLEASGKDITETDFKDTLATIPFIAMVDALRHPQQVHQSGYADRRQEDRH